MGKGKKVCGSHFFKEYLPVFFQCFPTLISKFGYHSHSEHKKKLKMSSFRSRRRPKGVFFLITILWNKYSYVQIDQIIFAPIKSWSLFFSHNFLEFTHDSAMQSLNLVHLKFMYSLEINTFVIATHMALKKKSEKKEEAARRRRMLRPRRDQVVKRAPTSHVSLHVID